MSELLKKWLRAGSKAKLDKSKPSRKDGKLTAAGRGRLESQTFALPGRRYPIPDIAHGRNALARVSQFGTPEEKSKVRAKVKAKFPGIKQKGK